MGPARVGGGRTNHPTTIPSSSRGSASPLSSAPTTSRSKGESSTTSSVMRRPRTAGLPSGGHFMKTETFNPLSPSTGRSGDGSFFPPAGTKEKFLRGFIKRNDDKMQWYDYRLKGLDPDQAYEVLSKESDFSFLQRTLLEKELKLKRGNGSLELCSVLQMDGFQPKVRPNDQCTDPFVTSLTTSRRSREERQMLMFSPALDERDPSNCRKRGFEPEYGNFSRYVAFLKIAQGEL